MKSYKFMKLVKSMVQVALVSKDDRLYSESRGARLDRLRLRPTRELDSPVCFDLTHHYIFILKTAPSLPLFHISFDFSFLWVPLFKELNSPQFLFSFLNKISYIAFCIYQYYYIIPSSNALQVFRTICKSTTIIEFSHKKYFKKYFLTRGHHLTV